MYVLYLSSLMVSVKLNKEITMRNMNPNGTMTYNIILK